MFRTYSSFAPISFVSRRLPAEAKDAPVQEAAANSGWHIKRHVRFQRNVHATGPFATAWQLSSQAGATNSVEAESCSPQVILWHDVDGAPSDAWWELVGSLYYWRLRSQRHGPCTRDAFFERREIHERRGKAHPGHPFLWEGHHDAHDARDAHDAHDAEMYADA